MPSTVPVSPRLSFRCMTPGDLEAMATLLGDEQVMAYYPRPKTREEAAAWIAWNVSNYARDGFGLWVIEDAAGGFVGDCGLTWQMVDGREDLEVGYHVLPERQGQGLATEAAGACRDFASSRGVRRLIALVHPENMPSQRVALKIGLAHERDTVSARGLPVRVYGANI